MRLIENVDGYHEYWIDEKEDYKGKKFFYRRFTFDNIWYIALNIPFVKYKSQKTTYNRLKSYHQVEVVLCCKPISASATFYNNEFNYEFATAKISWLKVFEEDKIQYLEDNRKKYLEEEKEKTT